MKNNKVGNFLSKLFYGVPEYGREFIFLFACGYCFLKLRIIMSVGLRIVSSLMYGILIVGIFNMFLYIYQAVSSIYNGKILHAIYFKKKSDIVIHMKPKYYNKKTKTETFKQDFCMIQKIAKQKNATISMMTTERLTGGILYYLGYHCEEYKKMKNLEVNETIVIDNIEITRNKDRVNLCAKYEFPRIPKMRWKQFEKTLTAVSFYDIKISL